MILQIETLTGGFSDWLFKQGPVFILLTLGIVAIYLLSRNQKKESISREERSELKLEKVSDAKDRLFERLHNAMTDWHLAIKETAGAVDHNTDVAEQSKKNVDKALNELAMIKRDLEDIKGQLNLASLKRVNENREI